ncbi:MAG: hypothetical protein ACOYXC_11360 [Candidatus Rifleibacteriota bacterium]
MKKNLLIVLMLFFAGNLFAAIESKISLDFRDTDVRDILKIIAKTGELGLVTEKSVRGNLTLTIKDASVKEALDMVSQAVGFTWVLNGSTIFVTDERRIENQTKTVKLRYYPIEDAARIVAVSVKADLKVATDHTGSNLILNGSPKGIEMAEKILASIDVPESFITGKIKVIYNDKAVHSLTFKAQAGRWGELKEHLKFEPVMVGEDKKHSFSSFHAKFLIESINEGNRICGRLEGNFNSLNRKTENESNHDFSVQFAAEPGQETEAFSSNSAEPVKIIISLDHQK